jgi:hypothetical protein
MDSLEKWPFAEKKSLPSREMLAQWQEQTLKAV